MMTPLFPCPMTSWLKEPDTELYFRRQFATHTIMIYAKDNRSVRQRFTCNVRNPDGEDCSLLRDNMF
jgi:hypothetical protein